MFTNVSMAGSGLFVVIIASVLNAFGITPEPGTIEHVVASLVVIGGWLAIIFGQLRRKDLKLGLFRK